MFKLEYLHEGSQDCPLIRLYDYGHTDVVALRDLCLSLAEGRLREVPLEDQAWVSAIGGCRLILRASRFNPGVRKAEEPFVMEYADEGWLEVADKLDSLAAGSDGYQWLTNEGDVNVLISQDGHW